MSKNILIKRIAKDFIKKYHVVMDVNFISELYIDADSPEEAEQIAKSEFEIASLANEGIEIRKDIEDVTEIE